MGSLGGAIITFTGFSALVCSIVFMSITVLTGITIVQNGRAKINMGIVSIIGCASMSTITGMSLTFSHLHIWQDVEASLCAFFAKLAPTTYCFATMSVLIFLFYRAKLVDKMQKETLLMKVVKIGISGFGPMAAMIAYFVQGNIRDGFCIPSYPIFLAVMLCAAMMGLSTLVIYKFVSALRAHTKVMTNDRELNKKGNEAQQFENNRLKKLADENLYYSSIAMGASVITLVCVMIVDIVVNDPYNTLMGLSDTFANFDMLINVFVVCRCSHSWIPEKLKNYSGHHRPSVYTHASNANKIIVKPNKTTLTPIKDTEVNE